MSDDLRTIAAGIARAFPRSDSCSGPCPPNLTCEGCLTEKALAVIQTYHKFEPAPAPTPDPLDYLGYMIGTAAAGIIEAIGMASENAHAATMLAQDGRCLDFKLGRLPAQYPLGDFQALIARQSLDHTSLAKLLSLPTEAARP
jgi:hypothetical protein